MPALDDEEDGSAPPDLRTLPDLRMPLVATAAWTGGLCGLLLPTAAVAAVFVLGSLALLAARVRGTAPGRLRTAMGLLLVLAAVATTAQLREEQVARGPVAELAGSGAAVTAWMTVTADPRPREGRFEDYVILRGRVTTITGRGQTHRVGVPVLVLADPTWQHVELGARIRAEGRLAPAQGQDLAGVLRARGEPAVEQGPDLWWRAADRVRTALRASVADRPPSQRALVPALVVGDDAGMPEDLAEDFRTTGLTHLLAVSGTNLTLLVGFLLVLGRWVGVRGRWLTVVAALGIVGFVLLARTEPSVVRAAAMGTVALVGLGSNGLQRGSRALGVAVLALLLVNPWLATTAGFALSVLATAGILLLAPPWRDALARWLPRWAAEAIAVPAAAQLACTPVVAAISGEVSLVAVVANLLAAPAVGPATVLGLTGGLLGVLSGSLGRVAGLLASWCVAWIVTVARWGAALPGAAVEWGSGAVSLTLLTVLCLGIALAGPHVLRHPVTGVGCCAVLCAAVLVPVPTPGWPPRGWVLAACDVDQGDALVLRAGPGSAVLVDAGPEPAAVDACLRRLEVDRLPLVVLTHFHADHVDGLAGALDGREVGVVEVTPRADPPEGARQVAQEVADAGATRRPATYGTTTTVGDVTLQVLWPPPGLDPVGAGDGSSANDASVVLLAEVQGVRVLLTGDIEPPGQARLATVLDGVEVDVLKVPHHGSRYQDLDLLLGLRPRLALVTVGADNDYGHPSTETLTPLAGTGTRVLRTDVDGDILVVADGDEVRTVTRGQADQ
ncbi:ComEC/Rec2 family competence protein [Nocardioides pacificus]